MSIGNNGKEDHQDDTKVLVHKVSEFGFLSVVNVNESTAEDWQQDNQQCKDFLTLPHWLSHKFISKKTCN